MRSLLARILRRGPVNSTGRRLSTSISDNQAYPQVCLDASLDYASFNTFRRNSIYNEILEHVSEEQGKLYLDQISRDIDILNAIEAFKPNDDHGGPQVFDYPGIGPFSPSTLRYIKVLTDLRRLFQSLDGLNICEIGIGYGGQCRVINAFSRPNTYCLVDIQPALGLAHRYLGNYVLPSTIKFRTMNELRTKPYDLVISNYAFSELPRAVQEQYLERVVLRSARGYITYNEITPLEFNSYKTTELLKKIQGARSIPEEPITHPKNCVIIWGDS